VLNLQTFIANIQDRMRLTMAALERSIELSECIVAERQGHVAMAA
jgi:hypothetical protein